MPELEFTIKVKTVSEANRWEHWAKKHRRVKLQRTLAKAATLAAFGKNKINSGTVTITRIGAKALDDDNLASSLKAIRDGIADAIGIDDGNDVVKWVNRQTPIGKHQYFVKIHIRWE